MIWLSWRQQRAETLIVLGVLALLAALLVPTGIQMADAYQQHHLAACLAGPLGSCGDRIGEFRASSRSSTREPGSRSSPA